MDQDAFRQLISSSSAVSSSSSPSNRTFGKSHKRPHATHSSASSSSTKPSDLKPRKLSKLNDTYTDRASARRSGTLESEFSDVEALHADFQARIAAAETEEERRKLRDQISSVGGDAKYSVLVKGLDRALLAQNKAKIERESRGGGLEGEEGDLEKAYDEGKRSADEVMDAIRRRREAKSKAGSGEKEKTASGFKPIGFKPIASGEKTQEDTAEYKWVNGKRMRRKKKATDASIAEQSTPKPEGVEEDKSGSVKQDSKKRSPSPGAADVKVKQPESQTSKAALESPARPEQKRPVTESQPEPQADPDISPTKDQPHPAPHPSQSEAPPKAPPADDDDDEDDDIFADVGGWDGIPQEDAEEEIEHGAILPTAAPLPTSPPPAPAPSEPISPPAPPISLVEPDSPPPETLNPTLTNSIPQLSPHPAPPTTTTTSAPAPPKKSKWADDQDLRSHKRKKKKKH